jgi:hypothetical protein
LEECHNSEIVRCRVEDYMTIAVDDRTSSPNYGYAFNCIDGTGIAATNCRGLLLQANRVIERQMRPTRELMERHQLGQFVKRAATKGVLVNESTWNAGYVNNWHQGSALVVTSPEKSDCIRILGNHVENAGQGIDIHADHVIVTGNLVINAFVGMKAMHGSRNVLIANNQFIRSDLWAIGLMPGAAAHGVLAGSNSNSDGGSIIANNIISDFGHGDSAWSWVEHTRAPIRLDHGQEPDDPPLHDVLVTGNVIYDSDRSPESGEILAGKRPGYNYAVFLSDAPTGPRRVRFSNNLLPAGTEGIANVPLSR